MEREDAAERTADAATAFLRSGQAPGRVQKDITAEMREAVEGWEGQEPAQEDALKAAAIRVAEAEHRSRFLGEGDDDLGPAMDAYAKLREQQ